MLDCAGKLNCRKRTHIQAVLSASNDIDSGAPLLLTELSRSGIARSSIYWQLADRSATAAAEKFCDVPGNLQF
jgi:hypothetical protein